MQVGYQDVAMLSKTKEAGFNEEAHVEGHVMAGQSLE